MWRIDFVVLHLLFCMFYLLRKHYRYLNDLAKHKKKMSISLTWSDWPSYYSC